MGNKKKYYFFGAGVNCCGAIEFWGKENIIAIVDNSVAKQGTLLEDIPIIDFEQFIKEYKNEKIIITAYIASQSIIEQLTKHKIYNYYICPYMTSGFWSAIDIIQKNELYKYDKVAIYENNPIADKIVEELNKLKDKPKIIYLNDNEWDNLQEIVGDLVLITKENVACNIITSKKIVDIFEQMSLEKEKRFSYLKNYKDIHKGEICFLIGNGPSLSVDDLEILHQKNVCCIGCNSIHKMFGRTNWRPMYYAMGDPFAYKRIGREIREQNLTCFVRDFAEINDDESSFILYPSIGEKYFPGYPNFSDDLVKGVYGGRTVMYDMLQIAAYMGFKEIYLLGVDFSWGEDGRDSHFCKEYINNKLAQEGLKYRGEIMHAYISAQNYADLHGIDIYNATRGGQLEVFKRVDFDELFQ